MHVVASGLAQCPNLHHYYLLIGSKLPTAVHGPCSLEHIGSKHRRKLIV